MFFYRASEFMHRTGRLLATTTPTMRKRFTIEEMNFRTFKHGFFLTHFLSVTARKNQRNSLRSGVNFSLTRPICSHSSKAVVVSGLLVLKVKCHSKKKPKKFFEKRSKFFANQTNLFSFIESCCCFWFVSSQGQWEFKKRQKFTIS